MKRLLLSASALALLALPAIASAQPYDQQHQSQRAAPAQSSYRAPAQPTYRAPAQQSYRAPSPTYRVPAQQSYRAPPMRVQPSYQPASRPANPGGAYRYGAPTQRAYAPQPSVRPAERSYPQQQLTQRYAHPVGQTPAQRENWNDRREAQSAYASRGQGYTGAGRDFNHGGQGWNRDGQGWNRDGQGWNRGDQRWNRDGQGWNGGENERGDWWRGHRGFEGYEGRRDGFWYAPGWGYYRPDPYYADFSWSIGAFVPYGLRNYYVNDPYEYGVPVAPYGYRWIFLDNQLVLIDLRTGLIVQVADSY